VTGSGESRGNGTALSPCGSSGFRVTYDAEVSMESVLVREGEARGELALALHAEWVGCGVSVGVVSECAAPSSALETGPVSAQGLALGLVEASDESSSPRLNFARRSLLLLRDEEGMAGGGRAAMERGTDASGVAALARSTAEGGAEDLARRGRPRRGLCAPGPRSVEKLSMLAEGVRVRRWAAGEGSLIKDAVSQEGESRRGNGPLRGTGEVRYINRRKRRRRR
jgi:hypothetical protein